MPKLSQILAAIKGEIITTTKKAAGILSAVLTSIEPKLLSDLETVMQDGIPIAIAAFTGGGSTAAVTAGIAYIKAAIPSIEHDIATALGAELAAQARLLAPAPAAVPAPII